jgi:hypothetical protein
MPPSLVSIARIGAACTVLALAIPAATAADKKVFLVGGPPSHASGHHEHNAGVLLLQKCLAGVPGLKTQVSLNGFPANLAVLNDVDAIIIYSDGGPRHPALRDDNFAALKRVLAKGTALGLIHYAVEPTIEKGQQEFLEWVGGAFEIHWSVNPHWDGEFKELPRHAVTRGVRPFTILDEWYFHMRFVESMKGVIPLLRAVPPDSTMSRPDGHHSGNPHARAAVARGEPQVLAWGFERPNGGRGFGFTGGHYHENWGNDDFRKLVLNAILWLAKMEVPAQGVASKVTAGDLAVNLDPVDPQTGRKIPPPGAPAAPAPAKKRK